MRVRRVLPLGAVLAIAPILWAAYHRVREDEAAADLLRAVATAHQRVGYEGEGAFGNEWPGTWVAHDARTGRTRYGTGPWSFVTDVPNSRMADPAAFCLDVEALLENYRASEGAAARHLGREARTLVVEPRRDGRPRLEILFDRDTLLPLKVKTVRHDGVPIREAVFHSLLVGKTDVHEQIGPPPGMFGRKIAPEDADEEAGFHVWRPAYLPEGFRIVGCRVSHWAGPCARCRYSDGVTAFEIWQRPVLTPAQIETLFARAPGGAAFHAKAHVARGRRALERSGGAGPDGVAVERHECGAHVRYELRVEGSDVTLVARADLDAEEHLRVLRSLEVR